MKTLAIDIETYSSVSLQKCGVYAYAQSPDFEILLFGYAWDDGPVEVIDLAKGQSLPQELQDALYDPEILKTAFNASFERTCLSAFMGRVTPPEQWSCTAVMARELGLPGSLEAVGEVIGLPEDKQKSKTGRALIRYFSIPCKPTKTNGNRTRNLPEHDPDRWNLYVEYNRQDVEAERAIRKKLSRFPIYEKEQPLWVHDQHMYWASASSDGEFRYEVQDGPWLDADEQLARYADWKDPTQWPVSSRKSGTIRRLADKQGDPTTKDGIVGAFCRTYSVEDAIEAFLPEVYIKGENGRYTYKGGSTSGGLVIYEDGRFAYSHHSTDPTCGKLCNAFDLVRIHMFGKDDEGKPANTAANNLPSYKNMCKWIETNCESVMKELQSKQLDYIVQLFGEGDEAPDMNWVSQLEVNPKTGHAATTVENIRIIVKNDPRFKGAFYFDEFMERPMVCGDLPWRKAGPKPRSWDDTDDAGVHNILEKDYKIDSMPKTREGVDLALADVTRHPVREYLQSLVWDGEKRCETVFIDYLGAEDSRYVRTVTRKALIGAAARILSPGCKHDHMLVLVGPQGCHKSTTLKKLGKDWFSDSLYTMTGKDAYEQLQGFWMIELGEMAATRKAEIESIKQFVSKQEDNYRAAYARRTQCHPRQCAFFGTTNDEEFLRDPTGARRFWPVVVTDAGKTLGEKLTSTIVDQIWAEVVTYYEAGETWYLDSAVEEMARKVQADHTEANGKLGLIENFLAVPLPEGWDDWDLEKRLMFWSGGFGEEREGTVQRTKVCALEIWQELFKGDPKGYSQAQAREIIGLLRMIPGWRLSTSVQCGAIYGRQRGFVKEV